MADNTAPATTGAQTTAPIDPAILGGITQAVGGLIDAGLGALGIGTDSDRKAREAAARQAAKKQQARLLMVGGVALVAVLGLWLAMRKR